ncbi:secretin receptor [Babesia caballi]|uniref:Secretin receptor n=1 Tax=Babesia caballi TaxID=5871 RepID=A0AAV4LW73_BABCB|nr:secretin receptor [Babesia caballi]
MRVSWASTEDSSAGLVGDIRPIDGDSGFGESGLGDSGAYPGLAGDCGDMIVGEKLPPRALVSTAGDAATPGDDALITGDIIKAAYDGLKGSGDSMEFIFAGDIESGLVESGLLAQHHVLRHTLEVVHLGVHRRVDERLQGLLETALDHRPAVGAVQPVARDGHDVPLLGHDVAQQRQVPIVHVAAVEADDGPELAQQRHARGLDAEHVEYLANVVRNGALRVHAGYGQHVLQVAPVGVQHPLTDALEPPVGLVVLGLGLLAHVNLGNLRHAAQLHVHQHLRHEALQKLALVLAQVVLLNLHAGVLDADAQYELVVVVVGVDAVDLVVAELLVYAVDDLLHRDTLVGHDLVGQLDAQHPRTEAAHVLVGELVVLAHPVVVLGHDGPRDGDDLVQRGVLEARLHVLGTLLVVSYRTLQVDGQRGRLDVSRHVDQLLQTRKTQRHVLGAHTSKVEGVQGHLRGRLADGLRGDGAHALAGVADGLVEDALHLAQQPVEGQVTDLLALHETPRVQRNGQVRLYQDGGIFLRLGCQDVLRPAGHDNRQAVQELLHALRDFDGVHQLPTFDGGGKLRLRVLQKAHDVDGQVLAGLSLGEDLLAQDGLHVQQALVFLDQHHLLAEVGQNVRPNRFVQDPAHTVVFVAEVVSVQTVEVREVELHEVQSLVLNVFGSHAVLAVEELQDITLATADGFVVVHHNVLHGLHQTALDVTGLRSLTRGVDNPFSTTHGVEKHFLGRQSGQVGVGHEAATLRTVVVLDEVRERAVAEAEGHTLALDVLLADTSNDLRNVDGGPFGPTVDHSQYIVALV